MLHPLLQRQLKKGGLNETALPTAEQWQQFLEKVDRAYTEADQERYWLERSLTVSSQEMQETYEQLRKSEARYVLATEGANDGVWDWDLLVKETYYSSRWLEILGINSGETDHFSKNTWLDKIHSEDRENVITELEFHLQGKSKHFQSEHRVLHNNGEYRWVLVRGLAVRNEAGRACRIAGSLSDITERKRAEERLAHDAVHDALTNLPNRKSLMERLEQALKRKKLDESYSFAIFFIDLDRFKTINDSLGHQAGDELLLQITKRLQKVVRPFDMVARFGGDEFVILVEKVDEKRQVSQIAKRVLEELQRPLRISGQEIYSSASIGVVLSSAKYNSANEILRDADVAMYRAKTNGKARFEIFESEMHSDALSLLQLEIDLRRALEHKELMLNYQPIISLETEVVTGFEALIRWQHPQRGLISPNDFIPLAEETGLILPIGYWVMREACQQMRRWQNEFPSAKNLTMSVNLSARQLEQNDLIAQISKVLKESDLNASCLRLEITESVIMTNAEHAVTVIEEIRAMGVRVSIDDFGTGYSSLSYLHRFPIDTLKVDRSFVSKIGNKNENAEIVQTIITLAYNLGMEVVAEGVESIEQLDFLRQANCRFGQGYYYSKPINSDDASKLIRQHADLR